jgi:hypothetical protein
MTKNIAYSDNIKYLTDLVGTTKTNSIQKWGNKHQCP